MKHSPSFNLQEQYKKYRHQLKNAVQGQVVTRFPPEPSGFLHIGHVKASMLNYHYSKMYDGKMIFRFDDTNPSKETNEFVDAIFNDLKSLGISWDHFSHTSDHFDFILKVAEETIARGLAYCDNTPQEQMSAERKQKQASRFRDTTPEENLRIFNCMRNAKENVAEGETDYSKYCLRAKIDYQSKNGSMQDPVIYRVNFQAHIRTGHKYVLYPTYDFACPIVDAHEGVTHAMRSDEYRDRAEQYAWFLKNLNLRHVELFHFSRLNMKYTLLSKRKLQWFVDTGRVSGWDDPRMPTVRGILRRGLRVETLTEFIIEQGPSENVNLQEWDKLWTTNKRIIDPIAPRFQCVKEQQICEIELTNVPDKQLLFVDIPVNPLNEETKQAHGLRKCFYSRYVYINYGDARTIKENEKITLMRLGNVQITAREEHPEENGRIVFKGEYHPEDTNYKGTQKINFLCKDSPNIRVELIELDHLITVEKLEEDINFETVVNPKTWLSQFVLTEPGVASLKEDDYLQFERFGYYRIDKVQTDEKTGEKVLQAIFTPDGRQSGMTVNIVPLVDQKILMGGASEAQEQKGAETEKKLSQKQKKKLAKQQEGQAPASEAEHPQTRTQAEVQAQAPSRAAAQVFQKQPAQQNQAQPVTDFVFDIKKEESFQQANKILDAQLYFSATVKPNAKDVEVYDALKQSKWVPDSKYGALFAWYGLLNQFNPDSLNGLRTNGAASDDKKNKKK